MTFAKLKQELTTHAFDSMMERGERAAARLGACDICDMQKPVDEMTTFEIDFQQCRDCRDKAEAEYLNHCKLIKK